MPQSDFGCSKLARPSILNVDVVVPVSRELAKLSERYNQRVQLFDAPKTHIDANRAAEAVEFGIRANYRRHGPPMLL